MKKFAHALLCALLICTLLGAISAAAKTPPTSAGQPIIMVDGSWNPKVGAWSLYRITDLRTKGVSTMYFSTLDKTMVEGKPARWLEVDVTTQDKNQVVTRILAEESAKGIGKVLEVIVQPKGYGPFTVPQGMLESEQGPKNDMQRVTAVKKVKKRHFTFKGERFEAWEVEGKDDQGRPVSALVSAYVAPLGLVQSRTADSEIKLVKFGGGVKTRIKGDPVNFYFWITQQVLQGLTAK